MHLVGSYKHCTLNLHRSSRVYFCSSSAKRLPFEVMNCPTRPSVTFRSSSLGLRSQQCPLTSPNNASTSHPLQTINSKFSYKIQTGVSSRRLARRWRQQRHTSDSGCSNTDIPLLSCMIGVWQNSLPASKGQLSSIAAAGKSEEWPATRQQNPLMMPSSCYSLHVLYRENDCTAASVLRPHALETGGQRLIPVNESHIN